MRQRRFAQAPTSDNDQPSPTGTRSAGSPNPNRRKRRLVRLPEEEEDDGDEEEQGDGAKLTEQKKRRRKNEEAETMPPAENVEPQPMGAVVRVSGKGKGRRTHYESFEYNGHLYSLEDPALFHPENKNQKPYVAIIKDIAQTWQGGLMITGQWFYRPEEAKKKGGGCWDPRDTRELFYSFHRDEVPAESIFHKCVVHFIPLNKRVPHRQQHPGFIVQQVYDTEQRMLFKLTDKDYEEDKQHEIDLLVKKTLARLGTLKDRAPEPEGADPEDRLKNRRLVSCLGKRNVVSPREGSRENFEGLNRSQSLKMETTEYYGILSDFKLLTGEAQRDRWLEKLLQSVRFLYANSGSSGKKCGGSDNESHGKNSEDGGSFDWPGGAISPIVALEKAASDALSADFQKYNQKMRQLTFNLKGNAALTRRLLNKDLVPDQILNMSPNELKEGLTAEEIASREPEESGRLQMTDARCTRCTEKQVGLIDIIQTGLGDRYQLECVACGNTWYASRDDAATLTIERPGSFRTVGTAPLATAKFEVVEKGLVSPSRDERKTTDASLLRQKSFRKVQSDEKPADTKTTTDASLLRQKSFRKVQTDEKPADTKATNSSLLREKSFRKAQTNEKPADTI
ncbi:bromo-adjacent homology (BAH) domain-containing protein [Striga hermonthica]|uniref:Bromo-adjacent homology (BAH) domain-containing protein n=1 Tax=Striga hermonthica TaxID=68872 RepID=A0A9N7RJ32_STRHE|nr:bromo-adjacent homology (BAH) domain-containing protein [Striga hermonthica]